MANRSTSNKQGEVAKPSPASSPEPVSNTVKRNDGPVDATDVAPTSEPLAEQPEKTDE
jgi:hypothetical protein